VRERKRKHRASPIAGGNTAKAKTRREGDRDPLVFLPKSQREDSLPLRNKGTAAEGRPQALSIWLKEDMEKKKDEKGSIRG